MLVSGEKSYHVKLSGAWLAVNVSRKEAERIAKRFGGEVYVD